MSPAGGIDRAAALRRAVVELVAEQGFHGTSIAQISRHAGVAAGTTYVHYPSKDALVLAAIAEVKLDLGRAAVAGLDPAAPPDARFLHMWRAIHAHLAADAARARFMVQAETSPYQRHVPDAEQTSPLHVAARAPDMRAELADLPDMVLFDLGVGPAARLAAAPHDPPLDDATLDRVAWACWRAITRPGSG